MLTVNAKTYRQNIAAVESMMTALQSSASPVEGARNAEALRSAMSRLAGCRPQRTNADDQSFAARLLVIAAERLALPVSGYRLGAGAWA